MPQLRRLHVQIRPCRCCSLTTINDSLAGFVWVGGGGGSVGWLR